MALRTRNTVCSKSSINKLTRIVETLNKSNSKLMEKVKRKVDKCTRNSRSCDQSDNPSAVCGFNSNHGRAPLDRLRFKLSVGFLLRKGKHAMVYACANFMFPAVYQPGSVHRMEFGLAGLW
eukprot:2638416-Rhodomonas_salina.1